MYWLVPWLAERMSSPELKPPTMKRGGGGVALKAKPRSLTQVQPLLPGRPKNTGQLCGILGAARIHFPPARSAMPDGFEPSCEAPSASWRLCSQIEPTSRAMSAKEVTGQDGARVGILGAAREGRESLELWLPLPQERRGAPNDQQPWGWEGSRQLRHHVLLARNARPQGAPKFELIASRRSSVAAAAQGRPTEECSPCIQLYQHYDILS